MSRRTIVLIIGLIAMACGALGAETWSIQFNPRQGMKTTTENRLVIVEKAEPLPGGVRQQNILLRSSQEVIEVAPDGSVKLELRVEKVRLNTKGAEKDLELALINKPILVTMTAEGAATDVKEPEDLDLKSRGLFDSIKQSYLIESFDYPKGPVPIGYKWDIPTLASTETDGVIFDTSGTKHYEFLGIKQYNDRACFEVQVTGTFLIVLDQGEKGQMQSEINVVVLLDCETGFMVSMKNNNRSKGEIIGFDGAFQMEKIVDMTINEVKSLSGN